MCVRVYTCHSSLWRSEDSLVELVLAFHLHLGSGAGTWVSSLQGKHHYCWVVLTALFLCFEWADADPESRISLLLPSKFWITALCHHAQLFLFLTSLCREGSEVTCYEWGSGQGNKRVPKATGAQMKLETPAFAKLLATHSGIFLWNAEVWEIGQNVRITVLWTGKWSRRG